MRRLALLALTVAVLAGCGGGGSGAQSPAELLAAAAARMDDEESARFTFEATMESRDLSDRPIPFSGEGVSTFGDDETGTMTMDFAKLFEIIITEEAETPEQREFLQALFGDPSGWQGELRFFGDDGYMRIPALTDLIGGKPWIQFDESDPDAESGFDVAFGSSATPASFLRYLRSLSTVEEVGREPVGGRQTTHYHATVDFEQLMEEAPDLRERLEQAIERTGQRSAPIDVWVDEEGLVRRIQFEDVSPPGEDEQHPTTFHLTLDLTEYGVEVDVERPPDDQVMSEAEFDALTGS